MFSFETVEKVSESEPKKNQKAHGFKNKVLLKSVVAALVLLLVATSILAAFEYTQAVFLQNQALSLQNSIEERDSLISQLNSTLEKRDTLITELNTEANWAQAVPGIRQPLGSQYLNMLSSSNQQGNSTKIFLDSTLIGYHYGPAYPFDSPWFNGTGGGYFSSQRAFELTDNRSISLSFWGWSWFSSGNLPELGFASGQPYLMIPITFTNEYTPADAGNGTDPSAPIGNSTGQYVSHIILTARLYSQNGSIIQADELGFQTPTAKGGQEVAVGSGQTEQVVFYLSPSSINIDHYEIYVSYLSSVSQY